MQVHFLETSPEAICPYCREPLASDRTIWCNLCGTPQHLYCWQEHNDSCSIFHCGGTQTLVKPVRSSTVASERRLIPYLIALVLLTTVIVFQDQLVVPVCVFVSPPLLFTLLFAGLRRAGIREG